MAQNKEGFVQALVAMANERAVSGFPSTSDELRDVIEDHDVVFGVWQDASQPMGVGWRLIKGDAFLHVSVDEHGRMKTKMTAIPCREAEEAEAMRRVFGEATKQH